MNRQNFILYLCIALLYTFVSRQVIYAGWNKSTVGQGYGYYPYGLDIGNSRNDGINRVCLGDYFFYEFSYSAGWSVKSSSITSGCAGYFGLAIGKGRNDTTNRIYSPYSSSLYEYTWTGSSYTQTSTVGTGGSSFYDVAVSSGRNDGVIRVYAANLDGNLYEFTYSAGSWNKSTVGTDDSGAMLSVSAGHGRNDGVMRIYAGGYYGVYEFTYSGGIWNKVKIATGLYYSYTYCYGIIIKDGRNDGTNRIYVASYGGLYELTYSGGSWLKVKLDDGIFYDVSIGKGKNDTVNRVYGANNNGYVYQYSYSGDIWYRGNLYLGGSQYNNEIVIGNGRNDGIIRVYATNTSDNYLYEFTWSGVDDSPSITITSPNDGATITGVSNVTVDANDDMGISKVEFYVDNVIQFTEYLSPFTWSWDTSKFSNTTHTLKVIAYDTAGQTATHQITVTITRYPSVSITNPASGATVSGTVSVNATATDDVSVNRVEFSINSSVQNIDYSSLYSWSWDTTKYADGDYTLGATAYDGAGFSSSTFISVKIKNNPDSPPTVSITNPLGGQTVSGNVDITVSASDDNGISKVEFYVDNMLKNTDTASPYSWSCDTKGYSNGFHTIKVVAYDTASQTSQAEISVNVNNIIGDNPPSVSITSPLNGSTVWATVNINVSASDDKGVSKVEFYVDNILNFTDIASPWTWSFDSTSVSDSSHTLKAIAYDTVSQTANNFITVLVDNIDSPPTITIKSPKNETVVSGNTKIVADASDDRSISKVEFYKNGLLTFTKTSTPYEWAWDTLSEKSDSYIIKAKAYDTSNQWAEDSITLIIRNATTFSKNSVFSYPNPATGDKVTFRYFTPTATTVKVKIYNVIGQLVSEFSNLSGNNKDNEIEWDISDVAPGIYVYVIESNGNRIIKKLTVAK